MSIPTNRSEMLQELNLAFSKLWLELEQSKATLGKVVCVDDWSVKDLLAIRTWWTEAVLDWMEQGRNGISPTTPAEGFTWKQTPQLNQQIVDRAKRVSYRQVKANLKTAYQRIDPAQKHLSDLELLEPGEFEWAGKLPVIRWIAINTTRQYTTACSLIRRAKKAMQE